MTIGIVNELGRSQNGKPKAKIDGKWYFVGRCNPDLPVGQRIEYEGAPFTTPNGKQLLGLNSWKAAPASNGHAPPSGVSDDAEMRFVSNCVGSAITAGTLKEPKDIKAWALAAQKALKALKNPDADFDDDLPEQFYGNGNGHGEPQRDPNEPNW